MAPLLSRTPTECQKRSTEKPPVESETSKATVYNTLNLFREKKMIREVIVDPSKVFYDPNTYPHHHFYNIATGKLTDIDVDDIGLTGLPQLPPSMATERVDIIVRVRPTVM